MITPSYRKDNPGEYGGILYVYLPTPGIINY